MYMQNFNPGKIRVMTIIGMLIVSFAVNALESDRQQKITLEGNGCISKLNIGQTECPKGMVIRQGSLKIESELQNVRQNL